MNEELEKAINAIAFAIDILHHGIEPRIAALEPCVDELYDIINKISMQRTG